MSSDTDMKLSATDLDDTRSDVGSDAAPNASDGEEDVFVPKELEDSEWPEEWPEEWPKPKFAELEPKLSEFKKAHKNVLPSESELPGLVFNSDVECNKYISDSDKCTLLYKMIMGVKNAEGKLDQQGQKDSLRTKWKAQFPKSKRAPDGTGFKLFSDESYLVVEAAFVPALESYVEALEEKAKGIDKGHQPTALLKQARDQLKRVQEARDARKSRVDAAQKKRRDAELAKKRSRPSKSKATKAVAEISDEDKSSMRRRYFDLVKELREKVNSDTGANHTMEEAFEAADEQFSTWEDELKMNKAIKA